MGMSFLFPFFAHSFALFCFLVFNVHVASGIDYSTPVNTQDFEETDGSKRSPVLGIERVHM